MPGRFSLSLRERLGQERQGLSEQLGFRGEAGGKGSTSLLRSLILLLFVGGLVAFFLINPVKWLPSQISEPLLVRVNATPDLQAWLEDAR